MRRQALVVGLAIAGALGSSGALVSKQPTRTLVLDHARVVDGTGRPPRDDMRVVVRGDRIEAVGPAAAVALPAGSDRLDLAGRVVMPGSDRSALPHRARSEAGAAAAGQRGHRFRDPGQWIERFEPLRALMRADNLPGPRMALAGPHIDGEHPAYPADSVVARDPERRAWRPSATSRDGAVALKIYFRLPLASASAVVAVCRAHAVPCTAHWRS